jgi:hypothetical protein
MVKNTVQRDEKRVIIYYTFDDEPSTRIQDSGFRIQEPEPCTQHPQPSTGSAATHE